MSIKEQLEEMKKIQKNLLDYLYYETNIEEKYQNLKSIFDDIKINDNKYKLKQLFYLILKIANNHHIGSNFFSKIDKVLELFVEDIKKYFSNSELFHIFKGNKRLLLFLLEEKLMVMDQYIVKQIMRKFKFKLENYPRYFQPEIQPFLNEEWFYANDFNDDIESYAYASIMEKLIPKLKEKIPDDFYEKRRKGENGDQICTLIQKDSIEEFIVYMNKNFCSVNSNIKSSIYDANKFLLRKNRLTLIEYAAFYGSTQIFNYLRKNGAELSPSLWICAVHGQNEEIIRFLDENKIFPSDNNLTFKQLLTESIKCHHIDVANYIQNNYLQYGNDNLLLDSIKYYNYFFIPSNIENETSFYYLCRYDYCLPASVLLDERNIQINMKINIKFILNHIFI